MNQEKMELRILKITQHGEENDYGAMQPVINELVTAARAATTDEGRDKVWLSLRSIVSLTPNPPSFARRPPAFTAEVQAVHDKEIKMATTAAITYFNKVGHLLTKRGGGLYENAEAFAESQTKIMTSHMTDRYQADPKIWDGTKAGYESQTWPVVEDNAEDSTEESV